MQNHAFFQNTKCEYFPCHKNVEQGAFNCLFCYCPLYALGDRCGGNFTYTDKGVKDCSGCCVPHEVGNYGRIMEKMPEVLALAIKQEK